MNKKDIAGLPHEYKDPTVFDNPFIDIDYIGDPEHIVAQVKDKFEKYKLGRTVWDQFFYENVAWASGRQYMRWNRSTGTLQQVVPATERSVQAVSNFIMGKVRTIVSRQTSFGPSSQVLPNSSSDKDIYGARAGKLILQHNYYNLNLKKVYREGSLYSVIMGMGWFKTIWDECGGRAFVDYEEEPDMEEIAIEAKAEGESFGTELDQYLNNPQKEVEEHAQVQPTQKVMQPKLDERGQPIMKKKIGPNGKPVVKRAWFEGAIKKTAVNPFGLYYDTSLMDWRDNFDLIEVSFKSVETIKSDIPNCQDLSEDDVDVSQKNPWELMFEVSIDRNLQSARKGLMVYEYWCKACESFPDGLHVIIVKDKVRVARPMPVLRGERLPYSFFGYIALPGTMRHMGLPELLIPIQSVLNKLKSQAIENAEIVNNAKLMKNSTTKFTDTVTTEIGQVIEWEGTHKPEYLQPWMLPQSHFELIKLMSDDMDFVSKVNKIAEGATDPSINSGAQVRDITENDLMVHEPETDELADAIADSNELELRYTQEMMPDKIQVRFFGTNGKLMTENFKGAVLRNNFSVRNIPGKMGNNSRQAQKSDLELVLPLVTQGQTDGKAKDDLIRKATEWLYWGENEPLVDEETQDINRIKRLILDLKTGKAKQVAPKVPQPPQVPGAPPATPDFSHLPFHPMPFDDVEIWKREIELVLKSEDFEGEEWQEEQKNLLMDLWNECRLLLQKMQMQAAQQVQAAANQAGGGGGVPAIHEHSPGGGYDPASQPGVGES